MITIIKIFLWMMAAIITFHLITKKFLNPYKLIMVFGKKGSGKSTLMTKQALNYVKRGIKVYTNVDIPFTYKIKDKDIGVYQFPPKSVIMVDEVGMIWDNRHYKDFKDYVRNFFKLQRHYKLTVYLFSQTFDIDIKLRNLTDEMYLVEKVLRVFSYSKRILKKIALIEATGESESKISENLQFDHFLLFWCGSRKLTFIPKYTKYFDSFEAPELEPKEFEMRATEKFIIRKGKIKEVKIKKGIFRRLMERRKKEKIEERVS